MFGAGKWMKCWGKWDNDYCPHCGQSEDKKYLLICQGADANTTWDRSLHFIQQLLDDAQTDPDINRSFIASLHNWIYADNRPLSRLSSLSLVLDMQSDMLGPSSRRVALF
jgi:hypothetical protein